MGSITGNKTIGTSLVTAASFAGNTFTAGTPVAVTGPLVASWSVWFAHLTTTTLTFPCIFQLQGSYAATPGPSDWQTIDQWQCFYGTSITTSSANTNTITGGSTGIFNCSTTPSSAAIGNVCVAYDVLAPTNSEWFEILSFVSNTSVTPCEPFGNSHAIGASVIWNNAEKSGDLSFSSILNYSSLRCNVDQSANAQAVLAMVKFNYATLTY